MDELRHIKAILEAALLVAGEPLPLGQLSKLFEPTLEPEVIRKLLDEIREAWADRHFEDDYGARD